MVRCGLLLMCSAVAAAAPVPRETDTDKIKRLYGMPEDPDKVCTFRLDGNLLRLTAAKGLRGLNPSRGLLNAPRTFKPVEGNFTITMRMRSDVLAEGAARADEVFLPSGGGGLLVWVDSDTHLRLSRSQWIVEDGGVATRTSYNLRGVMNKTELPQQQTNLVERDNQPVTFRLSRIGRKISSGYSLDGKTWKNFTDLDLELPTSLKVGVYAAHNFDKPLEVVFEPLQIELIEKKE